jgi:hypothetical protein
VDDLKMIEDRRVLRWGGLAGILGSIVMVVVFAIVAVFVGADVFEEGLVERFPDIRAARTVENGLYLAVLVLWMVHFLALYRALRATNLAAAHFGSVLGVVGIAILAAGSRMSRPSRSPTSTTPRGRLRRSKPQSSSCGRPRRAYSGRCSVQGSSSCQQASSPSAWA